MHTAFVLTIIGPDRPGLIEILSQTISTHEGNWLESRMAHLAGQFAGLLLVNVPAEHGTALKNDLHALESQGLRVTIESGDPATLEPTRLHRMELVGHDRPGLVRELTQELRKWHINVEELTSQCTSAPMSGEPLFKARLKLSIPTETNINQLQDALEQLAERLSLDLYWDPTPVG